MNETKLYQIKPSFAKHNNLMIYFAAVPLVETYRAVYLYGHGTTETTKIGVCCKCGRTLTHPVSVELGIGPECGKHWHDWDLIGGYNKENLKRLKGALVDIKFDAWVPKSQIVKIMDSDEIINVPKDHPVLIKRQQTLNAVKPDRPESKEDPKKEDSKTMQRERPPAKSAKMVLNNAGDRVIQIHFPYDLKELDRIRTLPGRKFHGDLKCWSAPISINNIKALQGWEYKLDDHLLKYIQKVEKKVETITIAGIPGLNGTLFPFQNEGVAFVESHKGRALIADDMGLGKTIQSLAWYQLHREASPVLVVCPASLKLNWKRETEKWIPNVNVEILSGETPYKPWSSFLVINYDILPKWISTLQKLNIQLLITDECQKFKNSKALRTKAIKQIAKGIPHVLALSGTPIENRPIEIYNAINLINPDVFPSFFNFAKTYCNAKHNGFGWDFNGSSNIAELHKILTDTIMIRRLKKDVLTELPDKIYSFIPFELENSKEYYEAEKDFIAYVRKNKGDASADKASNAEAFAAIEGLKQLAVKGKLKGVIEWVRDFIEVDKLVVFVHHRFVGDLLINEFKDVAVKVVGSSSDIEKQKAVDDFQNNPEVKLLIGSDAAKEGFNLTAASNVAIIEFPWTPGNLSQKIDRVHRIGQKKGVNVYYLMTTGTIEEKIARMLDRKRKILDAVMDGIETDTSSLLGELMKEYES